MKVVSLGLGLVSESYSVMKNMNTFGFEIEIEIYLFLSGVIIVVSDQLTKSPALKVSKKFEFDEHDEQFTYLRWWDYSFLFWNDKAYQCHSYLFRFLQICFN